MLMASLLVCFFLFIILIHSFSSHPFFFSSFFFSLTSNSLLLPPAEGHLSFPKITKPIKYASIGCALDGEGMGGITRQSANLSPFFGQIGKVFFILLLSLSFCLTFFLSLSIFLLSLSFSPSQNSFSSAKNQ